MHNTRMVPNGTDSSGFLDLESSKGWAIPRGGNVRGVWRWGAVSPRGWLLLPRDGPVAGFAVVQARLALQLSVLRCCFVLLLFLFSFCLCFGRGGYGRLRAISIIEETRETLLLRNSFGVDLTRDEWDGMGKERDSTRGRQGAG